MNDLLKEKRKTRESTSQIACWCLVIALHQREGVGKERLERIAGEVEKIQSEIARIIDYEGVNAGLEELRKRLNGICVTEMRVPLNRAPKSRKEEQLRMAADQSVTAAWGCFALAIRSVLGYGTERLNRIHDLTVENYRQFNGWYAEDHLWAFEKLRHCAQQALHEEVIVVQEEPEDNKLEGLAQKFQGIYVDEVREEAFNKIRSKASNAKAFNVISDNEKRKLAEKIHREFMRG